MDGNSYLYENFIYLGIKLTNYAVDKIKEIITKEENLQYIRLIYSDRKDEVLNIIISNDKVYDFYIKDITKVADSNQKIRLIMASDTDNLNNQRFIRKRSKNYIVYLEYKDENSGKKIQKNMGSFEKKRDASRKLNELKDSIFNDELVLPNAVNLENFLIDFLDKNCLFVQLLLVFIRLFAK